jgi:predicted Zn-dependent peptidase
MRLLFEQTPRNQLLQYLGFNPDKISEEIKQYISTLPGGEKLSPPPVEEKEPAPQEENSDENSFFENIASSKIF